MEMYSPVRGKIRNMRHNKKTVQGRHPVRSCKNHELYDSMFILSDLR